MKLDAIIFDVGNVLVDWNPRHLYAPPFQGDTAAMERFLATICTPAWHNRLDAGESFAAVIAETIALHPEHRALIEAYDHGWPRMFRGAIPGMPELLAELAARLPLYALTNFPGEKYADFCASFPFVALFRDVLVSSEVRLTKPDPRIFHLAAERFGVDPAATLFIDDRADNVAAAARSGFLTHRFTDPASLKAALAAFGL